MPARPRAFLDTSALFAGIWSSSGGGRLILRLGEAQAIQLLVSAQVLHEIENVIRKKAPFSVGHLALLLDRSNVEILPAPGSETIAACQNLIDHPGDIIVLAAAWQAEVDYFVTLDRKHFLENEVLRATAPFPVGTPGDFLAWVRAKFL